MSADWSLSVSITAVGITLFSATAASIIAIIGPVLCGFFGQFVWRGVDMLSPLGSCVSIQSMATWRNELGGCCL
ncbi:hypothetical protein [Methylomonas methanica]|uniref:hypothetical protein n=1 Tax=Methylomonas methanica TaxID=421 RepID=UPI00104BE485|nr:hypothetical protein [Methylomonas methanica]